MRKIGLALLFGVFAGAIISVSAARLYEWYETGHLTMHRKMPLGPDVVTYSSDPIGFLMEFDLYLFLLAMGTLGVLVACRDVFLEIIGPQSFFDLHGASKLITVFTTLLTLFFLAVFAVGVFQRLV
jgi:cytochrome b